MRHIRTLGRILKHSWFSFILSVWSATFFVYDLVWFVKTGSWLFAMFATVMLMAYLCNVNFFIRRVENTEHLWNTKDD